jgi:hypothetical protein
MVWLLVAVSIYAIVFVGGRAHSRHLDRLEAKSKIPEGSAIDPRSRMSNHSAIFGGLDQQVNGKLPFLAILVLFLEDSPRER